jgi:hypothetical protein
MIMLKKRYPSYRRTGGSGVSHNLKFPQEWGKQGVEKTFVNDLR